MNSRGNQDLTTGSITKKVIIFILPLLAGQIFQNLYNSVDAIIVGRFVSTTALAAVTSCSDIAMLLTGFFTGLSTGAGVLFSRYFGAKDYKKLHDSIHTGMLFSIILGLIMSILGIVLTPLLLTIIKCPPDVLEEANLYLRIYLIGILFTSIYNVGSGVQRAVGDSRSPFIFLVISSLMNIALDFLFVAWLKMGVAGVAVATIISQLTSVVLVFIKMMRNPTEYRFVVKDLAIDWHLLKEIARLGLPSGVQTGLLALSNLFVQGYINSFGSAAMAGVGAAKKIDKYVGFANLSIAAGASTFVSQNLGAGQYDRAIKGIRMCLLISFISMVALGVPILIFNRECMSLFTTDEAAIVYGLGMMIAQIPLYPIQSIAHIIGQSTRGFGKSFMVMLLSLAGMVGARQLFLIITMTLDRRIEYVYYSFPVGWAATALFVSVYYLLFVKRKYRKA